MANEQVHPGDPEPTREYRGTGVFWILVTLFVPLLLLVVMLIQNAEPVGFEFLVWEFEPPLYGVILVAALVGAVLTEGMAAAWRHQRRRWRTERSELQRLRAQQSSEA